MNTVNRRLELLKLEELGSSQPEIVNELPPKSACIQGVVIETEGVEKWRRSVKQEWRKPC